VVRADPRRPLSNGLSTMIRANVLPAYALFESATTNTRRTRHRVSNVTTWLWSGGEYYRGHVSSKETT
jgi:hypothetical protein